MREAFLFLAVGVLALSAPCQAAEAAPVPVKLEVRLLAQSAQQGSPLPLQVRLVTAANQPAPAPKALAIAIRARMPSGAVEALQSLPFASGESEKNVSVAIPGAGLVYVWAVNPELWPGGAFVDVRGAPVRPSHTDSLIDPKYRPPAPVAQLPTPAVPRITLRYSPDRALLADGRDAATVQAFLIDAAPPSDVRLNVFDSSGTLQPSPLVIPRGELTGRAALTSSQPGLVTVEFLGSAPALQCEGSSKLNIRFMPPITRLELRASPPGISLVDTSEIVARLTDAEGRPVATDAPRVVTFGIDAGRGDLRQHEARFAAGDFEASTTFAPEWSGDVRISASTPNLTDAAAVLSVAAPIELLLFSAAGGLAGGWFSYLKRRRSGRRRILIGLLTGFLLYWACIFLGLAGIGRGAVLNPLSAFALSTVGGWLQTEVFSKILPAALKTSR